MAETSTTTFETCVIGRAMVESGICRAIRHILGLRVDHVSAQMRLVEDLRCDILDLIEIPMAIEYRFGITISEGEVENCTTVGCYVSLTCAKLAIAFPIAVEGAMA